MSREIKFRVWNKSTNKWVHGPNEEVNLFGECILLGGFMRGVGILELNDCEILQYTGLKDVNGKEVYEGDIIKIYVSDDPEDLQWELGSVTYKECCFWLDNKSPQMLYDFIEDDRLMIEIVGNIFENPDLIKDDRKVIDF